MTVIVLNGKDEIESVEFDTNVSIVYDNDSDYPEYNFFKLYTTRMRERGYNLAFRKGKPLPAFQLPLDVNTFIVLKLVEGEDFWYYEFAPFSKENILFSDFEGVKKINELWT